MSFDDAFCKFPELETIRLSLKDITLDDAEQIFHLFNDLEQSPLFVSPRFDDISGAKEFITQSKDLYSKKWVVDWWITEKGKSKIIGSIRLARFEKQSKAILGYFTAKAFRGRGMMTEAVKAVVKFAFESMGLHRIEATDHPENQASTRVLEKVGFQREGLLKKHEWRGNKWSDSVVWSVLRDDFVP